jgi:hypothetical protein
VTSSIPKPSSDARSRRKEIAGQGALRVPKAGRVGRPPSCPVDLGEAGQRWWRWAWATPQATLWHRGFMEPLARRASLEDEYEKALESPDKTDAPRLLTIMMRFDDQFALTPAGAAKQHIVFVDEPTTPKAVASTGTVTPMRNRLKGMRD